jgi:hypothetical protein
MRTLCAARVIRLRVLCGPCPDHLRYHDGEHVFDGDILYVDASKFSDGIHIKPQHLDEVRQALVNRLGPTPSPGVPAGKAAASSGARVAVLAS